MLSEAEEKRIDEIASMTEDLDAIVSERGWTKHAFKILVKLQNAVFKLGKEERAEPVTVEGEDEWDEDSELDVETFQKMIDRAIEKCKAKAIIV